VCDSDSEDDIQGYEHFPTFTMPKSMADYEWEVEIYFGNKAEFINAIRIYGVHSGRSLKITKNDRKKVNVKCFGQKGKCNWFAYCGYMAPIKTWQLRKIDNNHKCSK